MDLFEMKNVNFKNILFYNNISIKENKTTFIVGESGSGKTTLLKLLNGTIPFDSGNIQYKGRDISSLNQIEYRKKVLLVSQKVYLFDGSIKDNFIKYYSYLKEDIPQDEDIKKYLSICDLNFPISANTNTLSGGEKQRVYNAIALSLNPDVLMLDEPTSALDINTSIKFLNSLKNYTLENNISLIIVSHNKEIVDKFSDEIINLRKENKNE